jgi:hypothetical protein
MRRRPGRNLTRTKRSHAGGLRKARREQLIVERLEDRTLLAGETIAIADATLNEIGSTSALVPAGSGGLDAPLGITLGPDGNLYVAGNGGAVRRYHGTTGQ